MNTIRCPQCQHEMNVGEVLGKASKGSRKHFSAEQIEKLKANLAKAREKLREQRQRG